MSKKVIIGHLKTGVPGLDNLLGGGFPELSFNLIAGMPGSGKTTLAHQIMFSQANSDHQALFFTVLGEPTLKMLRYQQQFPFFDISKVNESIHFINLSEDLLEGNLDRLLLRITEEIKKFSPKIVLVDSFRSAIQMGKPEQQVNAEIRQFIQKLIMLMSSWQATTFLIGEYSGPESDSNPVFAAADSILWLSQSLCRNSMMRKIQVIKIRGQAQVMGLHTFRISDEGIRIFPRAVSNKCAAVDSLKSNRAGLERMSMGIPGLDEMLGGGLPVGYALLVTGPAGSGKTVMANQFLAEGVRRGEPGVIATFEKTPCQLQGNKLYELVKTGQIGMIDTRSLDLSIDETLHELTEMINRMQAKRVVIDSLCGFELSLAPEFSENFHESLYRIIGGLTAMGITVLITSGQEDHYTELHLGPYGSAFLVDAIVVQRYVELGGQFKRFCSVVKVRGSQHSKDMRLFDITDLGIVIGETLSAYTGTLSGHPTLSTQPSDKAGQ
jgi:circadian clock protein KaiC